MLSQNPISLCRLPPLLPAGRNALGAMLGKDVALALWELQALTSPNLLGVRSGPSAVSTARLESGCPPSVESVINPFPCPQEVSECPGLLP